MKLRMHKKKGQPLGKKIHVAFSHRTENKTKGFMKGSIYLPVVLKTYNILGSYMHKIEKKRDNV